MTSTSKNKPVQTIADSKVDVTVDSDGRIKSTTITHPTSWFGFSKPVTTITHGDNGVHTVTTKDTGLFSWFSKPVTKTIIHNPADKTVVEANDKTFASDGFVSHHTLDAKGDIAVSNLFTTDNKFHATIAPNTSGSKTMVKIESDGNRVISTGDHETEYAADGTFVRDKNNFNTTIIEQGA